MVAPANTALHQDHAARGPGRAGYAATEGAEPSAVENPGKLRSTVPPAPADSGPAGDAGAMVSHLQQTDLFREYQSAFENLTGLPLALKPAGSFQPPLHGSKRLNLFCALMARRNSSCAACLQLQQRLEDAATFAPRTLERFAGLSESAVPVYVGSRVAGYLRTGQVFLRPPTQRRFKAVLRGIGGSRSDSEKQELKAAYFQTRIVAKKQYGSVIRLLAIFAKHLTTVSNQVLVRAVPAEPPVMTKARAFIAVHQSENMPLRDVARAVNMSVYYFCKVFKQTTSLTFTDYRARVRVEAVKQMLRNPYTRVTEAAYAAGFQSLSQFNRAFRRIEGASPTIYRHRLHPSPAATLASVARVA